MHIHYSYDAFRRKAKLKKLAKLCRLILSKRKRSNRQLKELNFLYQKTLMQQERDLKRLRDEMKAYYDKQEPVHIHIKRTDLF